MRHRPLLLWTAAFAVGIGMGAAEHASLGLVVILGALGLVLLAFGGRRWAVGAAGLALAGAAAGNLRLASFQMLPPTDVAHWADRVAPVTLTGTVIDDPEERRGGRLTLRVRAEQATVFGRSAPVTGEVYVAIQSDARPQHAALDYGDRVTLDGRLETPPGATNPGAFSWRDYLARRAVYCQMRIKRPGAVQRLGASTLSPYVRLAWNVRRHVLTAIKSALPPTQAAVLSGILIGHRADLPPDLMADFVHTGTIHILASAGLHVGVVAFWLLTLCERLTLPRKSGAAVVISALWLYALMAGGRPSVTRAVIMATIYFGAILFEREPDLPTSIAFAAFLILLLQPTALLEPGFQLSFLTVLTLSLLMPLWDAFWRPRIEETFACPPVRRAAMWMAEMAGLSLLAQVGAAPIVAGSYNEVSLSGWLANGLVVPPLFVLIPLGFLGALVWGLWHALGNCLFAVVGCGLTYITYIVRGCGEASWAYRAIESPSPGLLFLFYALIYGGTYALHQRLSPPALGGNGGPSAAARPVMAGSLTEP